MELRFLILLPEFHYLLFYAFAMQCITTLAIVKKETNTWKWPIIQLVVMSSFAYFVAFIAFQILR